MPKLNAELVERGVLFPLGFVSTPLCCPSRASILSGQYARHHGVLQNGRGDPLAPTGGVSAFSDVSTVATWLRDLAGYRTGLFGRYLNGYSRFSDEYAAQHGGVHYVPPGWDRWRGVYRGLGHHGVAFVTEAGVVVDGDPGTCVAPSLAGACPAQPPDCPHSTDQLRDEALAFIDESVAMGKRFFLYFSTQSPHAPACPAMRHRGVFSGLPPHRPPNYDEGAVGRDSDADKPGWLRQQGPLDAATLDAFRIQQLESLLSVDDAVGAILQKLRETGQDANTLVVYSSDNGLLWGEHRRTEKSCPYEECLRVPFVVRYPALAPLRRTERAPVMNIDLAPTFAALAGLDLATLQPPLDGRSLERLLDGSEPAWRTDVLGEHWGRAATAWDRVPAIPTFALVRGPRWKYVEYCTGETELYDLAEDPYELTNLASRQPTVVAGQAARLRELDEAWPATLPFACGVLEEGPDD
jgi:arylsulfatase A-like enzyme